MHLKMTDIAFILVLAIISLINHNSNLFLYGVAGYLVVHYCKYGEHK